MGGGDPVRRKKAGNSEMCAQLQPKHRKTRRIGFLSWNYGISPPETWIKASRVDVLNSLDTPGVWLSGTGWGKTLYAEGGLRRLDVDNINGYNVQWYWDSAISKWVLGANA